MQHVLLPGLRFAPADFQARFLAEHMPALAGILSRPPQEAPQLQCAPPWLHPSACALGLSKDYDSLRWSSKMR